VVMVIPKTTQQGVTNISERPVMSISDLATLRTAYVANEMASEALAVCREAQVAPSRVCMRKGTRLAGKH
jgi:hypothetical protein